MRRPALILLVAIMMCFGQAAAARDRALVIGINHYPGLRDPQTHRAPDLSGPVTDAQTFASLLEDVFHFDRADIKILTEQAATKQAILAGIENWLIAGSDPGDRVVLYFAGHGAKAWVNDGGGAHHFTSTLVTADAAYDGQGNVRNMIEGRLIGRYLRRLQDRRVTIVADSCHSGSVTRGLDAAPSDATLRARTITPRVPIGLSEEDYTPALQSEVKASASLVDPALTREIDGHSSGSLAVWSAATLDEVTYDLTDRPGGVFTQNFAEGLRDRRASTAGEPGVMAGALLSYVRNKADAFCRKARACKGLTPQLQAPPDYLRSLLYRDPAVPMPVSETAQAVADATSLLTHQNDFTVSAEILPRGPIHRGDPVAFRITAGESGTLVVLDANPDGALHQIFPNEKCNPDARFGELRASRAALIPDPSYGACTFSASDAGGGTLLVLVAEQALDLSHVIGGHLDMGPIAAPRDIVAEFAAAVQAPHVVADLTIPNGRYRWAFVKVSYVVEP